MTARRTLLGRLLGWQVMVTSLTCLLLVVGAILTGAALLRRGQDKTLLTLGRTICTGIQEELKKSGHHPEPEQAAEEFLRETTIEGHRLELWGADTELMLRKGEAEWPSPHIVDRVGGRCDSLAAGVRSPRLRDCSTRCETGELIGVAAADSVVGREARLAAIALLAVLPPALFLGAVAGRIVVRRLLRPVRDLQAAAARLEAKPGMSLGVGAHLQELSRLERSFDSLLKRHGRALDRERRFAQQASHELRTPLTTLRMRLEALKASSTDGSVSDGPIDAALADVDSLDRLIEILLVLARSEEAEIPLRPVNLCDVAREAVDARRLHRREPCPDVDEILILGHEELLSRAVDNLVENALKYAGARARIRVRAHRERTWGVLVVEDDGPGIPDEIRPYVFERFYRGAAARGSVPGAGLGLAVVDVIIKRHEGRVELGRGGLGGEEVRLYLPLIDVDEPPRADRG